MLKTIMNWLNSPITWGGWLKFCGIMGIVSAVVCAIELSVIWQLNWWTNLMSSIKKPFTKKEIDE